jgi:hypothetical protein
LRFRGGVRVPVRAGGAPDLDRVRNASRSTPAAGCRVAVAVGAPVRAVALERAEHGAQRERRANERRALGRRHAAARLALGRLAARGAPRTAGPALPLDARHPRRARGPLGDAMINPLSAPRLVWCRFRAGDVAQLDRLVERVRKHVGASCDITRTALARALVRKGLDLAKTRELRLESLHDETTTRIEYRLSPEEYERLTTLQKRCQDELPCSALPTLTSVQRAIVLLAITEAETQASFPGFALDVLASRWKRGSRRAL